jgi:hypothetical protein
MSLERSAMADEGRKHVQDVEREQITALEPLYGPTDVLADKSQHDVDARMRELERELTESSRKVAQARPEQSPHQVSSDQSMNPMGLLFGLGLTAGGAYLLMQRVTVAGGTYFWNRWNFGQNSFGLTLIPLLLGIGLLIYGKTAWGWALTGIGSLIILLGILGDLHMIFRPASLFEVFLMFGMLVAGLGLTARSLRKA